VTPVASCNQVMRPCSDWCGRVSDVIGDFDQSLSLGKGRIQAKVLRVSP
jgi:hypothetical protein